MIINLFSLESFKLPYSKTLSKNTPAQIQMAIRDGVAANLWSVGDVTCAIHINSNSTYAIPEINGLCAFIIGFDHNSSLEGSGVTFQFGKFPSSEYTLGLNGSSSNSVTIFKMNSTATNIGGWESSTMRTLACPAFLASLPQEWQDIIVPTTKYTNNVGGESSLSSHVTATQDRIFILAPFEVGDNSMGCLLSEGDYQEVYDYYKNVSYYGVRSVSNTDTWIYPWTRSPSMSSSTNFCRAITGTYSTKASISCGFCPAFRVA